MSLGGWFRSRRERRRRRGGASLPPAAEAVSSDSGGAFRAEQASVAAPQRSLPWPLSPRPPTSTRALITSMISSRSLDVSVDDGLPMHGGSAASAGAVPTPGGGSRRGSASSVDHGGGSGGGGASAAAEAAEEEASGVVASEDSLLRSGDSSSSGEEEAEYGSTVKLGQVQPFVGGCRPTFIFLGTLCGDGRHTLSARRALKAEIVQTIVHHANWNLCVGDAE